MRSICVRVSTLRSKLVGLAFSLIAMGCAKTEGPPAEGETASSREALRIAAGPTRKGDESFVELNGPPLLVDAPGAQRSSAVASDGEGFFVVWHDETSAGDRIVGSRMSASGEALDVPGIVIAEDQGKLHAPDVVFDGVDYVVAWSSSDGVRLARVDGSGGLLDPQGVLLAGGSRPRLALFDGGIVAAFLDEGGAVRAARLRRDLGPMEPALVVSNPRPGQQHDASVAVSGSTALVAWAWRSSTDPDSPAYQILAAIWDLHGSTADFAPLVVADAAGSPRGLRVAAGGEGFLLAWEQVEAPHSSTLHTAQLSPAGELQVPPSPAPRLEAEGENQGSPTSIRLDDAWLVVWEAWNDVLHGSDKRIVGRRLGRDGWLDEAPLEISGRNHDGHHRPAIAAAAESLLVAWDAGYSLTGGDIRAKRLRSEGEVIEGPALGVALAPNAQDGIGLASGGGDHLAVWSDWRDRGWGVFASRVSQGGVILDPTGVELTSSRLALAPGLPAVVHGDGAYFVAYSSSVTLGDSYHQVLGTHVRHDGSFSGNRFVGPGPATGGPAAAWDGDDFLVVWNRWGDIISNLAGSYLPEARIDERGLAEGRPTVGFDGNYHLVIWADPSGLQGSRVDRSTGAPLDVPAAQVLETAGTPRNPALRCVGPTCLLAWQDDRSGDDDVYVARLDDALRLQPEGGIAIAATAGVAEAAPSVTWDGEAFRVLWRDAQLGLRGVRVGEDGMPLGEAETLAPDAATSSAITSHGGSEALVAWTAPDPQLGSNRAFVRLLSDDAGTLQARSSAWGVEEDSSVELLLEGKDSQGRPLEFLLLGQPSHGRLRGTPPKLTYEPNPDFHGRDGFDFAVRAGDETSAPARAEILVLPVNDAPVALDATHVVGATSLRFFLEAADADGNWDVDRFGDVLHYEILEVPGAGELKGKPPALTYLPDGTAGEHMLRFRVSDGSYTSAPATVRLITTDNRPPTASIVATPARASALEPVQFKAEASDPDGSWLRYEWEIGGKKLFGRDVVHSFRTAGTHRVKLRASDEFSEVTAEIEYAVHGYDDVDVPRWHPEGTPMQVAVRIPNAVDAHWRFGLGSAVGLTAEHTYPDDGTYHVGVKVFLDDGTTVDFGREVEVFNAPPEIEEIAPLKGKPGETIRVRLVAKDPAGDPITWRKVAGPGDVSSDGRWKWHWPTPGRHEVTVSARDDGGNASHATFTVLVEPKGESKGDGCASSGSGLSFLGLAAGSLAFRRRRCEHGARA